MTSGATTMPTLCQTDLRRDAVRRSAARNGLDYVEVDDGQLTLRVYFLGKLPAQFTQDGPGLVAYFTIEGGDVIRDIRILDVDPFSDPDPERDDFLVLHLDRYGDFSPYTLHLTGVENIDPRYASVDFSFKTACPSDLDCKPACGCEPEPQDEPRPNYLAKDYASLRQLIFDRLALLVPDWTERSVPDLGVTLVELLAYAGDYLSYMQDAVATEAYLGTARQRISVRRHAKLVDYQLHEGCNARAWVQIGVSDDPPSLRPSQLAFTTDYADNLEPPQRLLAPEQLQNIPPSQYAWFEPLDLEPPGAVRDEPLRLRAAHNAIAFYTWGRRECCLRKGSTRATLLDGWRVPSTPSTPSTPAATAATGEPGSLNASRSLDIRAGDVLIFTEVVGARTGNAADADPRHRWAVRIINATAAADDLYLVETGSGDATQSRPTPLLEIEWAAADALPFDLCLSAIDIAPDCAFIDGISVACGNIVLVDHGRTVPDEPLPPVPGTASEPCCDCEGQPADVTLLPARFRPVLSTSPVTYRVPPAPAWPPASQTLTQDPRAALPVLSLADTGGAIWNAAADLLGSHADDRQFVCEIDNAGLAHLRFGDGELGRQPDTGTVLTARYRVGSGLPGNVGAGAISCMVIKDLKLDGLRFTIWNPLAAQGGLGPEPIADVQLNAPAAFRRELARAITAADYAALAERDPRLQRAEAELVWTGSWYEADVCVDPWHEEHADASLLADIRHALYRYRRMGHDLRVLGAAYVPITLKLDVCALPGYDRGHVKAALLQRFSARPSKDGSSGFFAPDNLSFGGGIYLSRIVAAAIAVVGVECATVKALHRRYEAPNGEIESGVLPLAPNEIAQLDNDPDHPERGLLEIQVRGGR
jgi:hypothetical protein